MGIFSILTTVAKNVLPGMWQIAKPLIDTGMNALSNMDGPMAMGPVKANAINPLALLGGNSASAWNVLDLTMDGPVSDNERKQEEILVVTQSELSQRQLLLYFQEQSKIHEMAFDMPVSGLVSNTVTLSLHLEYVFGGEKTDLALKTVGYNDHVYLHLIPKQFSFYKNLLQHDLFKFSEISINSQVNSGLDTSTMIGFFPVTTNTDDCSNGLLMQMCKKMERSGDRNFDYNIRFVSPDVITYDKDKNNNYINIKSENMFLEPNKIFKTDYLKQLDKKENTDLSYGTIVVVKQNIGALVGMSFNINMRFQVWDYVINGIKLSEIKDKNLNGKDDDEENSNDDDGDNDGSNRPPAGSSKPTGRSSRRVFS